MLRSVLLVIALLAALSVTVNQLGEFQECHTAWLCDSDPR